MLTVLSKVVGLRVSSDVTAILRNEIEEVAQITERQGISLRR